MPSERSRFQPADRGSGPGLSWMCLTPPPSLTPGEGVVQFPGCPGLLPRCAFAPAEFSAPTSFTSLSSLNFHPGSGLIPCVSPEDPSEEGFPVIPVLQRSRLKITAVT